MNKKTLYGVDKNQVVKQWSVWTEDAEVIVEWGNMGGKMQVKRTICSPKNIGKTNEKTARNQAKLEAQSKWNKQYDKYYRESVEEAKAILTEGVMLAEDYTKKPHLLEGKFYVSRKLDGLRVKTVFKGDEPKWYSRGGKEYEIPKNIKKELLSIKEYFPDCESLDGEAYIHGTKLQDIQSCVKKHNELTHRLTYQIFDVPMSLVWDGRLTYLLEIFNTLPELEYIKLVEQELLSKNELDVALKKYILEGYEGAMMRNPDGKYLFQNNRSSDLLKYKLMKDSECQVLSLTEDKNGLALFTVVWYSKVVGKKVKFELSMNGSHKSNSYSNMKDKIGSWINFKYQDVTKDGIPTFARGLYFRECDTEGNPIN